MANRWIEFEKDWAVKNNILFSVALTNPLCKSDYLNIKTNTKTGQGIKRKQHSWLRWGVD